MKFFRINSRCHISMLSCRLTQSQWKNVKCHAPIKPFLYPLLVWWWVGSAGWEGGWKPLFPTGKTKGPMRAIYLSGMEARCSRLQGFWIPSASEGWLRVPRLFYKLLFPQDLRQKGLSAQPGQSVGLWPDTQHKISLGKHPPQFHLPLWPSQPGHHPGPGQTGCRWAGRRVPWVTGFLRPHSQS